MSLIPVWEHLHHNLPYIHEPFNNDHDVELWRSLGYTQSRFTGDMYDMRFDEPDWMAAVRELIPVENFAWSLYRMRPGDVLPEHRDIYLRYREIYNIEDTAQIRRYIIFLEDWQSGHYLEIDGTPILQWRAGQGVYWHGDTPHLAANIGKTSRYTLQITGTI
jgi:hypothetical protein